MAKWDRTSAFRRHHKALDEQAKAQFKDAVRELNRIIVEHGFDFSRKGKLDLHTYSGFARPPAVWSMGFGAGSNHRALFAIRNDVVMWEFIGTHDQIDRWQKDIGPKGLQEAQGGKRPPRAS